MTQIYILVGFEESQAITIELRKRGYQAFSCDLQDCSGGHPEWHLKMDIFLAIHSRKWDMIILHPPCTYTAICGNRWYWNSPLRSEGIDLCRRSWQQACQVCDHVALEQPKTIMQRYLGKKSQAIQPWQYGHGETKETWLWLKNLPLLEPTNVVEGREHKIWKMAPTKDPQDRQRMRSKTYLGIAQAIAEQWGRRLEVMPNITSQPEPHTGAEKGQEGANSPQPLTPLEVGRIIKKAHDNICRAKGKEYAPTIPELQQEIDRMFP